MEQPYACDICGNQYSNEYRLKCHKVIHGGLNLNEWRDSIMKFRYSATVTGNGAVHSAVNSFALTSHEKTFCQSEQLTVHTPMPPMNTHLPNKSYAWRQHYDTSLPFRPRTQAHNSPVGPYVCMFCDRGFSYRNQLLKHVRRHAGQKPFRCPECGKQFVVMPKLQQHMVKHTDAFACRHCSRRFPDARRLNKHMLKHTDAFECRHCSRRFAGARCLNKHMVIHTDAFERRTQARSRVRPYVCMFCDKGFRIRTELLPHIRRHTGEKPFRCPVCGKQFAAMRTLKQHMVIHTDAFECQHCSRRFANASHLKEHIMIHAGAFKRRHSKAAGDAAFVTAHEAVHSNVDSCALTSCENNLTPHRPMDAHTPSKSYTCGLRRNSPNTSTRSEPRTQAHSRVRPYVCMFCNKGFRIRTDLLSHIRRHTGEKPFRCSECGKQFAAMRTVERHMAIHTDAFECQHCSRRFANASHLKRHMMRRHSEAAMSMLEQHMVIQTHTSECRHCSQKFANACSLNKHIGIHADDGPRVCQQCGKVLACGKTLRLHMTYFHMRRSTVRMCRLRKVVQKEMQLEYTSGHTRRD